MGHLWDNGEVMRIEEPAVLLLDNFDADIRAQMEKCQGDREGIALFVTLQLIRELQSVRKELRLLDVSGELQNLKELIDHRTR